MRKLTVTLALAAMLATPAFAAPREDRPTDPGKDRNIISRLITKIVHLFDTPGAIFPVPPQP
jgi:hypothetical protein